MRDNLLEAIAEKVDSEEIQRQYNRVLEVIVKHDYPDKMAGLFN